VFSGGRIEVVADAGDFAADAEEDAVFDGTDVGGCNCVDGAGGFGKLTASVCELLD
jgi:hypothetical protein